MKSILSVVIPAGLVTCSAFANEPALTIYNQNFAVVRDTVPLELKSGVTEARFAGVTAHVEPDSVILRDPTGKRSLQILEQNYRNDPVSQELLLSLFEGKTIDFQKTDYVNGQPQEKIVRGKIIRSGYVPHYQAMPRYGPQYYVSQMAYASGGSGQPIIEVDGKLQFMLPGQPLFPDLGDDTILKPTLSWLIQSDKPGEVDAEVGYITGGMSWHADYNLVSPEKGGTLDLVGWVTMDNQSGKSFEDARIKLMAGDVNKIRPNESAQMVVNGVMAYESSMMPPPVTEKAFDEYHLYALERRTTLRDRETKQVEFVRATGIASESVYVYDGVKIDANRYRGWGLDSIRQDRDYGTQCNPKVWVMREFVNSTTNHLGLPLPQGRLRFYRRDADGQMEFTGEDTIDHTPCDETVRAFTGNAFDLVGERRRTDFKIDTGNRWIDESFEIKLRNHKKEPVEIRVVEHLYRWHTWQITEKSNFFHKTDAQTIEFRVPVKPDEEQTVSYTVHYSW
jgi:hypothetical protein